MRKVLIVGCDPYRLVETKKDEIRKALPDHQVIFAPGIVGITEIIVNEHD